MKKIAWVYYTENIKNLERTYFSLDFLSKANLAALWIKPQGFSFNEQEIILLLNSFPDFNCVLWEFSSVNSYSSSKIRDKKRAFGEYRKLSKNVFSKQEKFIGTTKYYSDLSILNLPEVDEGKRFFYENIFGKGSTFNFIGKLDFNCDVFEPLVDIYLKRRWSEKYTKFTSQYIKFKLANYVNNITSLGGIATFLVEDTETSRSIILVSKETEPLQTAFVKLECEEHFSAIKEDNLSYFIKRGIGLANLI